MKLLKTIALVSLLAARNRLWPLAVALAVATSLSSPLAGAFLVMAAVLIVRPWGLFGRPEAAARRTPGLTVNPWRRLTSNERLAAVARAPKSNVATSPGSTCMVKNTMTLTPIRTSTSWPSRPMT